MRLARSLARARISSHSRSRESESRKKEFQCCSSEELARLLARSFACNVCAREKMEFSGVELQVEISIGGQRGLVSHARAGAAAFLISLFSVRPLPSSIATCSSSSSLSLSHLSDTPTSSSGFMSFLSFSLLFFAFCSRSSFFLSFGVGADVL